MGRITELISNIKQIKKTINQIKKEEVNIMKDETNNENIEEDQKMKDEDYDETIDIITYQMEKLSLKDKTCNICKDYSPDLIYNICDNNCKYYCHKRCLKNWILYRGKSARCVLCMNDFAINKINKLFNKNSL